MDRPDAAVKGEQEMGNADRAARSSISARANDLAPVSSSLGSGSLKPASILALFDLGRYLSC
jgi:hypothetical protein